MRLIFRNNMWTNEWDHQRPMKRVRLDIDGNHNAASVPITDTNSASDQWARNGDSGTMSQEASWPLRSWQTMEYNSGRSIHSQDQHLSYTTNGTFSKTIQGVCYAPARESNNLSGVSDSSIFWQSQKASEQSSLNKPGSDEMCFGMVCMDRDVI